MTQATDPVPSDDSPNQRLFATFPSSDHTDWRHSAEQTLKGAAFEKRLLTKTYEGITVQPIYSVTDTAALPHSRTLPGMPPYVRGTHALGYLIHPWEVAQEMPYPTVGATNSALREDLLRGLTALNVPLDQATLQGIDPNHAPATLIGHGGVSLAHREDLVTLFDGIALAQLPLYLTAGASALPIAALVLAAAERHGIAGSALRGCLGADPLGALASHGMLPGSLERTYDLMAHQTAWSATHTPHLRTISIAVHPYHNGGASAVQDLAFGIATGVDYLRAMHARGLHVDLVAPRMQFAFSIGASFFIEIARLRAARLLWARVVAAFGGNSQSQRLVLHGRTSAWTKTRNDAYNNMLRATTEAFAGVMGGCDSLHISPFDEAVGLPDAFSRRIARNVHVILAQECNFFRLVDPAGGAAAVETLTDQIAREAWSLFQTIERQGGMAAALVAGVPQSYVATTCTERLHAIAQRREVIVGANMYANLKEQPIAVRTVDHAALKSERMADLERWHALYDDRARQDALDTLAQVVIAAPAQVMEAALAAARVGATLGDLTAALRTDDRADATAVPIPAHRGAEQFEVLRATAEQYAARTGARPTVFLATMGSPDQYKARADFATSFFEVGGFSVRAGSGFATVEDAAQAAHASGAAIVVICSTDDRYPELVPPLTRRLKTERPDITVVLAGYPTDQVEAYTAAGVDEFIHVRADCYAILSRIQQLKGVIL